MYLAFVTFRGHFFCKIQHPLMFMCTQHVYILECVSRGLCYCQAPLEKPWKTFWDVLAMQVHWNLMLLHSRIPLLGFSLLGLWLPGLSPLGLQPPSGRWSSGRGSPGRWSSGRGLLGSRFWDRRCLNRLVNVFRKRFGCGSWLLN